MHKLISIGNLGSFVCYLDISKEEAIEKVAKELGVSAREVLSAIERGWVFYREFEFNEAFYSYEAGPLEYSGFPFKATHIKSGFGKFD